MFRGDKLNSPLQTENKETENKKNNAKGYRQEAPNRSSSKAMTGSL